MVTYYSEHNSIPIESVFKSSEVGGSYHMELAGLKRVKEKLDSLGVKVRSLITDRHAQVQKWVRERWPDVEHYYDIWHVAKGYWGLVFSISTTV